MVKTTKPFSLQSIYVSDVVRGGRVRKEGTTVTFFFPKLHFFRILGSTKIATGYRWKRTVSAMVVEIWVIEQLLFV